MKRLLLLRHAEAVPSAHDDHARTLSARGRADAARVGAAIEAGGWRIERALVSDARRTDQTFEGLGLRPKVPLTLTPALYNAGPSGIVAILARAGREPACLLAVGHNPGIALAARLLTGQGRTADLARLASAFPTSALAVLRFEIDDWAAVTTTKGQLEALLWVDGTPARS